MAEIVNMPKLGFDMAEGTLVRWVIAEGETVNKGSVLAEIETDKATVEVEASVSGILLRHLVEQGTAVPVNTPIAVIGQPGETVELAETPSAKTPAPAVRETLPEAQTPGQVLAADLEETSARLPAGVRASPLARRLASETGIDLRNVIGTGPKGRITKEDVEAYLAARGKETPPAAMPTPAPAAEIPPVFTPGVDRRIPLTKLRAIIGKRMIQSVTSAPHFFVTHEMDAQALMDLRQNVNQLIPENEKTSLNDFIVRAAALTLREYPNLNASIDEAKGEVIQHGAIHIGIAVALDNGLITVVCKHADQKSIRQISSEIRLLVNRAREGKVKPEDIEGSTFSVSNLGMFDVDHFTAIINPPEAAILAVGSVKTRPVVEDGQILIRPRLNFTISVDHRISDGAEAARFLQTLAGYIEQPLRLLI
jgi:pyruvate dehydrogenase E2 component (dihydrolipoamide acetyltransferase)